jgi:hypothetical protein
VLAGIAFLAIEINQNTRSQELTAYQEIVTQIADIGSLWITEPENIEEIYRLLNADEGDLSVFESRRVAAYAMLLLRYGDLVYFQYQRGVITEDRMRSGLTILGNITCTPFVRRFWPGVSTFLDASYADYLGAVIQGC